MILRIMLRPSHRSFAWLSQIILSRLLVIDLQAGKFRTIPAMKYRPAVLWCLETRHNQIKSIGVPFCHPMVKGISIGRSFCHILCHIAILRAKCAQDSQKDSYSHPLCQRRGPIERRATASLERASSECFGYLTTYHIPSVRGLRTIQCHHLYWKVLCESSERYGPSEGVEQLDLHIWHKN